MNDFLWSPSQILRYRSCPRQWQEMRAGNAVRSGPPDPYRASGVAVHAGLAVAYRETASLETHRGGQMMSLFAEVALEALDREWGEIYPDSDEDPELRDFHNEAASALVMTMSRLPVPQPTSVLAVEERVVIESPEGFREQVIPDLILRTGSDSLHVRDWKRAKITSLPRVGELHRHDQLGPYALAARTLFPGIRKVTVGLYSYTARREIVAEMPAGAAEYTLATHAAIATAAENAGQYPATPDGRNCSSCLVRAGCPAWRGSDDAEDM